MRGRACGTRGRTGGLWLRTQLLLVGAWAVAALATGCARGRSGPGGVLLPVESAAASTATESDRSDQESLSVASIACGDAYDFRAERLTHVTAELTANAEAVYVVARLRNVPEPGELVGRWEHLDSGTCLAQKALTLSGPQVEARYSLTRPTKAWPTGKYKFYLSANGEDVAGIEFRVQEEDSGPGGAAKGGGV